MIFGKDFSITLEVVVTQPQSFDGFKARSVAVLLALLRR
jgi:hypothetical protein